MKRRTSTPHFLQNSGRGTSVAHAGTLLRKPARRMSDAELGRLAAALRAEADRRISPTQRARIAAIAKKVATGRMSTKAATGAVRALAVAA